jgi:23S rRNA pseudouridine1911/1915/1917 synthase
MTKHTIIAQDTCRIDKFLPQFVEDLTRSRAEKLIDKGYCTVNDVVITCKSHMVQMGDSVTVNVPEVQLYEIVPENIPLDIRYDDDDVIVVNKPKGMVVHPAPGHYSGTLVNALMRHCGDSLSGINGVIRPGIVHRIDKDTSGLLIIAKNDIAHVNLSEQLKEHTISREYEAVVHGRVKTPCGTVNAPLGRSTADRKKMCVTSKGSREAVTHYEVIAEYDKHTHVRLKLETGRTHQIRVHMAYIGHSVLGDAVYGRDKGGQCLHARKLGFVHPETDKPIQVESELPEYFTELLERL